MALAAELLAEGEDDPDAARARALHGTHPDLTWVKPTGAHVMRVSDVDGPVVAAAGRTPFESKRRVFVLERVDTMNDEVANRLLKTLEEPPSFVHLILLTDQLGRVLETVVSRCQLVRFDPLPADRIAEMLEADGIEPRRALASGRLSLGNAARARYLASDEGMALRGEVERLVLDALGAIHMEEPWRGLLLRAEERREAAEAAVEERKRERLEQEPRGRERTAMEREFDDTAKRDGRRARTEVLELGLELAAIAFRDLVAHAAGADAAVLSTDRIADLAPAAEGRDQVKLREAAEACEDTRSAFQLNVTEELALSALTFRLRELVAT
jgi:DNA polymerase-3 subunit delta'